MAHYGSCPLTAGYLGCDVTSEPLFFLASKQLFLAVVLSYSAVASSQTLDLVCEGTKTVRSVSDKNVTYRNFKQTYIVRDGKIGGHSPEVINPNIHRYTLSQSGDLSCTNFCAHQVILNSLTGEVIDTNYSVRNGARLNWEFTGICRPD